MDLVSRRYGRDASGASSAGGEAGTDGPAPGKRTLTGAIQRKADGASAAAAPGDAYAGATSGAASPLPHRAQLESAFGQSFAGVEAHVGTPEARAGLADLGARAAAHGESVAFAEPHPDVHLVAHEVAHVVQQRNGGGGVQAKPTSVSDPGDAAELAADRAADAVVRGEPVPDVGSADGVKLHRTTVVSNGGTFDNGTMYQALSGTGKRGERVGANITVEFTANDLVEAPASGIALMQTVKSVTDHAPGAAALNPTRDQGNTAVTADPEEAGLVNGNGFAVDISVHRPGRTDANHNPIYGVGFDRPDASTNLQQANPAAPATASSAAVPERGTPSLGTGQRGSHVRKPDGSFDPAVIARMQDGPGRVLELDGQSYDMSFEVTALVTDGPMVNTYLGSVEWGWTSDAAGAVTLKPFVPLSSGAPTANFMAAATTWNNATFHTTDATPAAVDTIDIPLTTLPAGVQAAVNLPTADLIRRVASVRTEATGLAPGSTDRINKDFELRALDSELRKRRILVDLTCNQISDTGGAARPAEDEVWLTLEPPGLGATITGTRTFRAGDSHPYSFPVTDFLPLDGPVKIRVMEHDRAGRSSRAHDDAVLELDWAPPFDATTMIQAGTGDYQLRVRFDR